MQATIAQLRAFLAKYHFTIMKNLESSVLEGSPVILMSQEQLDQKINDSVNAKFDGYEQKEADNDLMDVDRAADFLGISKKTLYLKTSKKEVPFSKIPGTKKLWFSKEQLTDWIRSYEGA